MEATTIVRVRVKDVNDLDPFFQPSSYSFNVPEDTPLHQVNTFYFKHYNKFSGNFHWVCFCRPKAPDTTFFAMPHCTLDRHKNYPRPSGIIFVEKQTVVICNLQQKICQGLLFFLSGKKGLEMKFQPPRCLRGFFLENFSFCTFQSVGQVQAEDADSGINGEIYFSLVDPNSPFAVDPVTGVISLTRPLSYAKNPRHTINVVAQDRGAKSRFAMRAPDTAKVQLSVRQVISVL